MLVKFLLPLVTSLKFLPSLPSTLFVSSFYSSFLFPKRLVSVPPFVSSTPETSTRVLPKPPTPLFAFVLVLVSLFLLEQVSPVTFFDVPGTVRSVLNIPSLHLPGEPMILCYGVALNSDRDTYISSCTLRLCKSMMSISKSA